MRRVRFYFDGSYNKSEVSEIVSFFDDTPSGDIEKTFQGWLKRKVHAGWEVVDGAITTADLKSSVKWFSVKDRLPSIGDEVLVTVGKKETIEAKFSKYLGDGKWESIDAKKEDVICWTLIPKTLLEGEEKP